ncbi:MAG: hypothetical protein RLY21_707 [Planctomycetota bacterium]
MTQSTERRSSDPRTRRRAAGGVARGVLVSIAIHGGIAAAILGTAWGVARAQREEAPPVVLVADFFDPAPARPNARAQAETEPQVTETPAPDKAADLASKLRALEQASAPSPEIDGLARRFGALSPSGPGAGSASGDANARAVGRQGASFAGLVAGTATKVAYVVDASGSMIGSFPEIVDEVERSISRLEPSQQFTVICFRRDSAVAPRGDSSLRPASRAERAAAVEWLRKDVIPSGRSSPIAALALALQSGADCVFLLSTTVTGPGSHELDRDSLLALLERLNPPDASTGRRRATIQCIQFLEDDPGRTLEAVATRHFGTGGYRFISRVDAGLDRPTPSTSDATPTAPNRRPLTP